MPPRGHKESASESESKQPSSHSRNSNKARNAVAQAAQQEFLLKHINSNGVHDKPKVEPLDFMAFNEKTLDQYGKKYELDTPLTETLNENILSSEIGKKTYSYNNKNGFKISKIEKANNLKKHFIGLPCRENEIITNFLYKVKNEDKDFKLSFK